MNIDLCPLEDLALVKVMLNKIDIGREIISIQCESSDEKESKTQFLCQNKVANKVPVVQIEMQKIS